jgi:hypothetical protein
MEIALPSSLEALVRARSRKATTRPKAESAADALRLTQIRDEIAAMKRDRLEDALDRGYEDIDALFAGL